MRIEKTIEIGRPIEEVFAFIRDPDNDPVWCPTVHESAQVELKRLLETEDVPSSPRR